MVGVDSLARVMIFFYPWPLLTGHWVGTQAVEWWVVPAMNLWSSAQFQWDSSLK